MRVLIRAMLCCVSFRAAHEKSVVPMLLEFRGFLAKRAANALAEMQFCSRLGSVGIREAFPAKVFHLCEKFLELSNTAVSSSIVAALERERDCSDVFAQCHRVWRKSSPASTTWQENMGKRTGGLAGCGKIIVTCRKPNGPQVQVIDNR